MSNNKKNQQQQPEQQPESEPSLLYRFFRGMANATQREATRTIEYNKLRYIGVKPIQDPNELLSNREQSFADMAKENADIVRTQELADRIVFQDQVGTSATLRKVAIETVYNYSFIFTLISASVIAWLFSRDKEVFNPEEQDAAYTSLFSTLTFIYLAILYLENLYSHFINYVHNRIGYFKYDFLAEGLTKFMILFNMGYLWFMVIRWNFYLTAVALFAGHIMDESGYAVDSGHKTLARKIVDMRYVRESTIPATRDNVYGPQNSFIISLGSILGILPDKDNTVKSIFLEPNSIYLGRGNTLTAKEKAATFSTDNVMGKLIWFIETKLLNFTEQRDESKTSFFGSPGEEEEEETAILALVGRVLILYITGMYTSDQIYQYALDHALYHLPDKAKVVAPIS